MELQNMSISGAGNLGGGEYAKVSCSGSSKILGNLKCLALSMSGATKVQGSVTCQGAIRASGSSKIEGDVVCNDKLSASGATRLCGDVRAESISCSGATKIEKDVDVKIVKASGVFRVGGDCYAETVKMSGGFHIGGELNAEQIELSVGVGCECEVGSIGGGTVKVSRETMWGLWGFLKKRKTALRTLLIEADRVELENTAAQTVRCTDAVIGEGCEIEALEYSGTAEIHPKAKIGNAVKI